MFYKKKRSYGKKRYYKKRAKKYRKSYKRIPRSPANGVHFFKRIEDITIIQPQDDVDTVGSFFFRLNDLSNFTEYTNLFDVYRITGIKLMFRPNTNVAFINNMQAPSTVATIKIPRLYVCFDMDDTGVITIETLRQKSYCKVKNATVSWNWFIRPRWANIAYETNLVSGYTVGGQKKWLNSNNPGIPHYGIKWGIEPFGTVDPNIVGPFSIKVEAVYYFQCKSLQ